MFRPIVVGLFGLVFCVGLALESAAQQAPSSATQPPVGRGRGPGVPLPPALLRDKNNYVDLTGLAKVRWTTRASGFHPARPLIKLMDGAFLVGDHAEASTTTFLESEFACAGLRWMKLDINRIVTIGRYGPVGEASSWADPPDLSKVDEVGFADLMPEAATALEVM